MSLVPAFEIGIWNAWIFMVCYLLTMPLLRLLSKDALEKSDVSAPNKLYNKKENGIVAFYQYSFLLAFIYSIFLPLKLGTTWFYVGLPICLLGFALLLIAYLYFAAAPPGKPLTRGLHRYSRHPVYLTQIIFFIGIGITTASWVFLVFTLLRTISSLMLVIPEERYCIDTYGGTYREYINKTPRWLGLPKTG
ncbi:MAG: methyltransferase [Dehalococcoidia bacterium]|jgi:protein-S-isoprenylcysteine O-methyltransferase Ste14